LSDGVRALLEEEGKEGGKQHWVRRYEGRRSGGREGGGGS